MTDLENFPSGTVFNDRYVVEFQLGAGGYSEVLAARDQRDERSVALKVLHSQATQQDPRAVVRMRQEAEILRAVRHPNIVRIFSVESFEDGEFLVMERIDGVGLDALLEDEKTLSTERLLPLVRQILDALQAAHAMEVLHRDIKPENILITDQDGVETIKIVDFGVAKAGALLNVDDPDDGITLVKTRAGNFVGTPRYAAPEMVVGDPCAPATDLFCLGLVVYEALAGEPLIQGSSHNALMHQLVYPKPFDLSAAPEPWSKWLAPLLEKAPDRRVATAEEARRLLDEVFGAPEASAGTSSESAISGGRLAEADAEADADDEALYPAFGDDTDDTPEPAADTEVSELAEENIMTNQWKPLDIDQDELERNRARARDKAARNRQEPKRSPQSKKSASTQPPEETSSSEAILQFIVFALLAFVIAGILFLWLSA